MKNQFKILLIIGLLFTGLTACNKDKNDANIDFRKKYVGSYTFFSYKIHQYMATITYGDSTFYTGSVSIVANTDSIIQIRYKSGDQFFICGTDSVFGAHIEPQVDVAGTMKYQRVKACSNQSGFKGNLSSDDSIHINIYSGGQAYSETQIIRGKKMH